LDQAIQFLINAGTSLREGGILRLSTPNLEWVIHTHFQTGSVEKSRRLLDTLRTNRAFRGWGHQFLFSAELLAHILHELGYTEVTACTYGQSFHPELHNLEKHGNFVISNGFPSVVIFEASRGITPPRQSAELMHFLAEHYLRYVASGH
jgi:hypothetical protein